ncbi:MAG: hypothetical protein RLZZ117_1964 [Cyanobacteriota bacterium]|jgi:hypothetical protein
MNIADYSVVFYDSEQKVYDGLDLKFDDTNYLMLLPNVGDDVYIRDGSGNDEDSLRGKVTSRRFTYSWRTDENGNDIISCSVRINLSQNTSQENTGNT